MTIVINLFLVIWSIVALLMILVILMQRPKSEGLGAAFGGGVTENIFGAQTTNVLTKITGWLAAIFFILTFTLSVLYAHHNAGESALSRELKKGAAPGAATSPAPGAVATASPNAPAVAGSPAQSNAPPAAPTGSAKPSDLAVGAVTPPPPAVAPSASVAPSPKKQ